MDEDLASVAAHTTWLFALCYARITIRVAEPKTSYSPYKMMLNRLQPTGTEVLNKGNLKYITFTAGARAEAEY